MPFAADPVNTTDLSILVSKAAANRPRPGGSCFIHERSPGSSVGSGNVFFSSSTAVFRVEELLWRGHAFDHPRR